MPLRAECDSVPVSDLSSMVTVPPGVFNPHLEDPLPGQMKKQLVLKIISGQQLPKPKDSMLGDRGEVPLYTHTVSLYLSS